MMFPATFPHPFTYKEAGGRGLSSGILPEFVISLIWIGAQRGEYLGMNQGFISMIKLKGKGVKKGGGIVLSPDRTPILLGWRLSMRVPILGNTLLESLSHEVL